MATKFPDKICIRNHNSGLRIRIRMKYLRIRNTTNTETAPSPPWSSPSDNLQVVRTFNYAANNNNCEQLPERDTEQLIDVNIYHSLFVSLSRQIIFYNCSIKIRQSYIFMGKNVIYSRVGVGITILKRDRESWFQK